MAQFGRSAIEQARAGSDMGKEARALGIDGREDVSERSRVSPGTEIQSPTIVSSTRGNDQEEEMRMMDSEEEMEEMEDYGDGVRCSTANVKGILLTVYILTMIRMMTTATTMILMMMLSMMLMMKLMMVLMMMPL